MMYKHQIDEQIKTLVEERRKMQHFGQREQVMFIQRKIDSWYRVREKAPEASIGAKW